MAGQLLTKLSLAGADGVDVPLIAGNNARIVTAVSGLNGVTAREVVVARSGRSGSRNLTRYRDDAQIVINGILNGSDADDTWSLYDVIAGAFTSAVDTDRVLKWTAGKSLALQRNVRLTALDPPLEVGPDMISYQATLRGADPNVYGQTLHSASAGPLGSSDGGGLVIPVAMPFHFQMGANLAVAYTNSGFVPTSPLLTLTGYLRNPVIQLKSDVALIFKGELSRNDTLVINVAERTVLLNGTANRRYMLDTVSSTWFDLPVGSGTLTLFADDFTPGAAVTMTWRDART